MNFSDNWTPLAGGNVNLVALKGNVVRRKLTPVSPAIHQLLKYLETKNFLWVPRLLDCDDEYEYFSYFPGKAIFRPWCDAIKTDEFIAQLGKWLKSYHEVVADFRLKGDVHFNWGFTLPEADMIVCHGDLGPWNCIQENGKFQGIIDWDLAHYGYAMDDIAEFAFEFIPFQPNLPEITGEDLSNASLIERLEVFCQAYGNLKPDKILEHIPVYLTRMNADLRKQASLGIEPFVSFVAGGIADKLDRHKAYVLSHWLNY
jgi:Phosphotransferase enzyme family